MREATNNVVAIEAHAWHDECLTNARCASSDAVESMEELTFYAA